MSIGIYVLVLLTMAFATEALVELLVKSEFFRPPREFVSRWAFPKKLFNCGYCMSVWVAMGMIAAIPTVMLPLSDWPFVNVLITLLLVHRMSNIMHNVIDKWTDKYYSLAHINSEKDHG